MMLGKAQMPSPEHPMGVAVCGTPIAPGLVVFTNEYKVGVVEDNSDRATDREWFDVRYPDGRRCFQNGERVATEFEGKRARDVLLAEVQSTEEQP